MTRQKALGAVVALGLALRLWQWAAAGPLWVDEIAVADNVLRRDAVALVSRPLDHHQQAPAGFLLAVKLATTLFGRGDRALRIWPTLGGIAGLLAFAAVAHRLLRGAAPLVATALFATAVPAILYGVQLKQYETDMAATALLLWLAVDLDERGATGRRAVRAAAAGALAPWFSMPATVVLAAAGAFLLVRRRAPRPAPLAVWRIVVPWALSAGLAAAHVFAVMMAPATRSYLHGYWARGFGWPLAAMLDAIGGGPTGLGYWPATAYLALAALGLAVLARRRPGAALLLALPVLIALAAAAARQLPFAERLILYLVPVFLLAVGAACELPRPAGPLLALLALAGGLRAIVRTPPPYVVEDVRPALARLAAERRPGDLVYVYYGAAPAAAFYGVPGLYGNCHRGDPRRLLEELDALRGAPRAWVLLAHALPLYRERDLVVGTLDAIGVRRERLVVPGHPPGPSRLDVELLLYDLSGAAAPARAAPLPEVPLDPGYDCEHSPWNLRP